MAAPLKKRAIEQNREEVEDRDSDGDEFEDMEGSDESGDEEMVNQEINVDFEARTATDSDFHGIKKLVQQVFLKANVNTSELTNTIISQNYVGSVIKQCGLSDADEGMDPDLDAEDDEDEVYGLITVVNVTEKKDLGVVKDIRKLLSDRCKQCASKKFEQFHQLMEDKQIGYVLSERFINIPAQLAPPMYTSLKDEMKKAVQKKMKFGFDYYLLIAKTYQTRTENKKAKKDIQRFFINTEEELFYNACALSFEYNVTSEKDTVVAGKWDDETEEFDLYRTVMLVENSKFDECIGQIQEMYT